MNTEEGNKLILLFMGGQIMSSSTSASGVLTIHSIQLGEKYFKFFDTDAKYHSSWDWLMPVVEKIEGLKNSDDYEVDIFGRCCDIGGKIETAGETKIIATWKAVIQFIKSQPNL